MKQIMLSGGTVGKTDALVTRRQGILRCCVTTDSKLHMDLSPQ